MNSESFGSGPPRQPEQPNVSGLRLRERLAELTKRRARRQLAAVSVAYLAAVIVLSLADLPLWGKLFGAWISLAVLAAFLMSSVRQDTQALLALYQSFAKDLEQQINDLNFTKKNSAITDSVTGVYTNQYLETRLYEEIDRARRYKRQLAIIIVDIVQFSKINNQYGRVMGDQILRRFGRNVLRTGVRSTDIVARYGGDQFAVLLPETDPVQTEVVIRRLIERADRGTLLPDGRLLALPIRIGSVAYPQDAPTADQLMQAADAALHRAKARGTAG